ncbi:MAG: ATP synthase F0 subunit B [Flavobacteriaceae bacterium]|nr:ATP synthase F0 subunit B [Flavobacteriaceae bacterium]
MDLVTPGFGLVFWATLTFSILLFILGKFAWKPILAALSEREKKISDSLELADRTKREMEAVAASNENLLQETRLEREKMMKEARTMKDEIIGSAKKKAEEDARQIVAQAKEAIDKEKALAMKQLKDTATLLSIDIAEKILRCKLGYGKEQEALISEYIDNLNLN